MLGKHRWGLWSSGRTAHDGQPQPQYLGLGEAGAEAAAGGGTHRPVRLRREGDRVCFLCLLAPPCPRTRALSENHLTRRFKNQLSCAVFRTVSRELSKRLRLPLTQALMIFFPSKCLYVKWRTLRTKGSLPVGVAPTNTCSKLRTFEIFSKIRPGVLLDGQKRRWANLGKTPKFYHNYVSAIVDRFWFSKPSSRRSHMDKMGKQK